MESKAASPRKVFGCISGCFWKKSIKTGSSALESASDLSSSGESDFFRQRYLDEPGSIVSPIKILFKPCEFGAIRNNIKATEITQFLGVLQKHNQKRVRWDGKNALEQKSLKHRKSLCLRGLPILAWKWETKETGTISSRLMASSRRERNRYLSLSNLFWQSSKISAKVSCLYVII